MKLSVFDLLAARFWPERVRLRDLWDDAQTEHPILAEFDVDPYYILQAIAIYTAKGAPSCKRGDVLKMEVEQIHEGWNRVVRGVADMLQMLRDDCGVVLPNWLPYNPILIPAGAVFAKHGDTAGPQIGARCYVRRAVGLYVTKRTPVPSYVTSVILAANRCWRSSKKSKYLPSRRQESLDLESRCDSRTMPRRSAPRTPSISSR